MNLTKKKEKEEKKPGSKVGGTVRSVEEAGALKDGTVSATETSSLPRHVVRRPCEGTQQDVR